MIISNGGEGERGEGERNPILGYIMCSHMKSDVCGNYHASLLFSHIFTLLSLTLSPVLRRLKRR